MLERLEAPKAAMPGLGRSLLPQEINSDCRGASFAQRQPFVAAFSAELTAIFATSQPNR